MSKDIYELVLTDCNFERLIDAYEAFCTLFLVQPEVYVRGVFKNNEGGEIVALSSDIKVLNVNPLVGLVNNGNLELVPSSQCEWSMYLNRKRGLQK